MKVSRFVITEDARSMKISKLKAINVEQSQ
jgi:hypothetical protein